MNQSLGAHKSPTVLNQLIPFLLLHLLFESLVVVLLNSHGWQAGVTSTKYLVLHEEMNERQAGIAMK